MPVMYVHLKNTSSDSRSVIELPHGELKVLILLGFNRMTAPEICRLSGNGVPLSEATCYKLLQRLTDRGLVARENGSILVAGVSLKRVFFSPTFDIVSEVHSPTDLDLPEKWCAQT
jgi:hypothetical protein